MTFSPKYPRKANQLTTENITVDQLKYLFDTPKFLYSGQRNHEKNKGKRKHCMQLLRGDSQRFAGAYCKELRRYVMLDGYHRGTGVVQGTAWFPRGATLQLTSFYAETAQELKELYDQFNSAQAAKKATCYFDSGLREAVIDHLVKSGQIMNGAKAYAVQMASGLRGTSQVRDAVVALKSGILFVNKLKLERTEHEMAGVLGAFFAIAQHCPDRELVEEFIRNVNANVFDPVKPTAATRFISAYHHMLTTNEKKTGGTPNHLVFTQGLAAFVKFANARRGRKAIPQHGLSLAEFIGMMETWAAKPARV